MAINQNSVSAFDSKADGLIIVSEGNPVGTTVYTPKGEKLAGITNVHVSIDANTGINVANFEAIGVRLGFAPGENNNVEQAISDETAKFWRAKAKHLEEKVNRLEGELAVRMANEPVQSSIRTSGYLQVEGYEDGPRYETTISVDSGGEDTDTFEVNPVCNNNPCCGKPTECVSSQPSITSTSWATSNSPATELARVTPDGEVILSSAIMKQIVEKTKAAVENALAKQGFVSED